MVRYVSGERVTFDQKNADEMFIRAFVKLMLSHFKMHSNSLQVMYSVWCIYPCTSESFRVEIFCYLKRHKLVLGNNIMIMKSKQDGCQC